MIRKLSYIESSETYPYHNLAMEEYLLLHCLKEECILYLWQNQRTIVIGKNQNAWKECKVSKLEEDGGYMARRLSGGGAVYHDLGNLNFTFLTHKENYDVEKQTAVILKAIQKLGIMAEKTGRNDIVIEGQKFSGHAYYEKGHLCYHHGTIMVNVNMEDLTKYLTVSKEKLKSKGIDSVRSRVCNLTDYLPELTLRDLKASLLEAFEETYGMKAHIITESDIDEESFKKGKEKFESWDWKFGRKIDFQYEITRKFSWGIVNLQFSVSEGKIRESAVYSDSINTEIIEDIPERLRGIRYNRQSIKEALSLYTYTDESEISMMNDIIEWIDTEEL